jgi:uncharacterized protein YjbI with pentapeptide repeats
MSEPGQSRPNDPPARAAASDQPAAPSGVPAPAAPPPVADSPQLASLRGAANEAAVEARGEYLTFMAFALYFLSAIGATTDEQLLRGGTVTMPLLGVGISIVGFYVVVPFLFLLAHLNMLIHLDSLAGKLNDLRTAAGAQWAAQQQLLRTFARYPLAIFEKDPVRWPIRVVAFCSVVLLPLVVLLAAQIRFLPYHSVSMAWWQRGMILIDLALILLFWQRIVPKALSTSAATRIAGVVARALPALVIVVMAAATVPGEAIERTLTWRPGSAAAAAAAPAEPAAACSFGGVLGYLAVIDSPGVPGAGDDRRMLCLSWLLFEQPETPLGMRRNLVVNHADLVTVRPADELVKSLTDRAKAQPDAEARRAADRELQRLWQDIGRGVDLRGRDLRFADLTGSDLRKADLRGANLRGAKLINADMSYAYLSDLAVDEALCLTSFDPASRTCRTDLSSADLSGVKAKFGFFWKSVLESTRLRGADLSNATLSHATITAADLAGANIADAVLDSAVISADLGRANLAGANLRCATLSPDALRQAQAKPDVDLSCAVPPRR